MTPEEQVRSDRAVLDKVGVGDVIEGARRTAIAGADIATLPARAVMGAVNTALRLPNAYGAGIPYIPNSAFGGDSSSMTPFYDRYVRQPQLGAAVPTIPNDQGRLGADGRPVVSGMESFNRSPESKAIIAAKAASVKPPNGGVTPAPQPATSLSGPFTDFVSTNPESRYDDDIEFTHVLSRLYGMAGRADRSLAMRDMYQKLNEARIQDVGIQAQKALLAGDVTKLIAQFNHMVPNGRTVIGHRTEKDGSFSFKYADGAEETYDKDQLMRGAAMWSNPSLIGETMKARAKASAELQGNLVRDQLKAQYSLQQAVTERLISGQQAMELESWKAKLHPRAKITVDPAHGIVLADPSGEYVVKQQKNPMSGQMEYVRQPIAGGQTTAGGAQAAPGGYSANPISMQAIKQRMGMGQ